jgi:hypothetical protein
MLFGVLKWPGVLVPSKKNNSHRNSLYFASSFNYVTGKEWSSIGKAETGGSAT